MCPCRGIWTIRPNSLGWYRIVPAPAPGVAAAKAFQREPRTEERPVCSHRLDGKGGAARRVATPSKGTEDNSLGRRENPPVDSQSTDQAELARIHPFVFNKLACPSKKRKSRSTSTSFFPTIEFRAMRTRK